MKSRTGSENSNASSGRNPNCRSGIALKHTQFAKANCATIRLKLLKIGALVRVSVRRIKLAMASSFPHQREFRIAHARLAAAAR